MLHLPTHPEALQQVWRNLRKRQWLLISPTIAFTFVTLVFALTRTPTWQASQAIVVRDEAVGGEGRFGSFESADKRKALQETILEVARSHNVVVGALQVLGPPSDLTTGDAASPSESDIRDLQNRIKVGAPRGAEFGKTDVIYLSVTGNSSDQAKARTSVLCDQLEKHLSGLRDSRAAGLVAEQDRKANLAQAELNKAVGQLKEMEREVGLDLGDLRSLSEVGSGDGNLNTSINQLKSELRQADSSLESLRNLHQLLIAAGKDPDQLVATTARLLESQPALRKLREGLVEAQLYTAKLRGDRSDIHPAVIAAKRAEERVREDLFAELENSLRGTAAEIQVAEKQMESLQVLLEDTQARLDRLASLRAPYGSLVSDVKQRETIVENAKRDLADAHARQSAAHASSLLTRFQSPETGDRPIGPGKTMIVGGGILAGLLTGIGLVVLTWPSSSQNRRWSDLLDMGRRATDRLMGRRASDQTDGARDDARSTVTTQRRTTDSGNAAGRRGTDQAEPLSQPVLGVPAKERSLAGKAKLIANASRSARQPRPVDGKLSPVVFPTAPTPTSQPDSTTRR